MPTKQEIELYNANHVANTIAGFQITLEREYDIIQARGGDEETLKTLDILLTHLSDTEQAIRDSAKEYKNRNSEAIS